MSDTSPSKSISLTPPDPEGPVPTKRSDCLPGGSNEARPCRWMSCRHHLAGKASCALDVAEEGPHSKEEVAEYLGISRQRVQQIEDLVLFKLKRKRELLQFMKD